MGKRLVSRAEFARIADVTRAAVTKACKGQLAEACEGKAIDLDHEAVETYLAAHGKTVPPRDGSPDGARSSGGDPERKRRTKPTAPRPERAQPTESAPPPRRRPAHSAPPAAEADEGEDAAELGEDDDIERYAHLTVDQVVRRFGRRPAFRFWLDARKKIADIREKELKNDETTGRLIERELVRVHVFGALEATNRRLLGDTPKTLSRKLYALAKSGAPVEEAEKVIREALSSQLKAAKSTAAKALRNA